MPAIITKTAPRRPTRYLREDRPDVFSWTSNRERATVFGVRTASAIVTGLTESDGATYAAESVPDSTITPNE